MTPVQRIQRLAERARGDAAAPLLLMAVAMAVVLALYAVSQLTGWPPGNRGVIADGFDYVMAMAAILSFIGAARRCRARPRLRSAWLLLAIGGVCYLAGNTAQSVYELTGRLPYPSVADLLYLAFYPIILWGLLRFSASQSSPGERMRLGLDLAVVGVSAAAVMTYVVLGPTVIQSSSNPFKAGVSIAYPVGDMILIVGLGFVLLNRTPASSRRALEFLVAGMLFFVAADVIYNYIQLHSGYPEGDPIDSLWMIAIALFAIAGTAQTAPEPAADLRADDDGTTVSWLPYIAVAVGFGLLIVSEQHDSLLPQGAIVFAAVILATLVSVRQLLAQRDLVRTQQQLSFQSMHDPLTELPNRALVMDRMTQMLARARRLREPIAALYVDIDEFKQINDTFGHGAGDQLLRVTAGRLRRALHESDTVGRLGGDEFVALLDDCTPEGAPERAAERIREALREPVEVRGDQGWKVAVTASIGIAIGLDGSPDELLHDADQALYEAANVPAGTDGSDSSAPSRGPPRMTARSRSISSRRSRITSCSCSTSRSSISSARR